MERHRARRARPRDPRRRAPPHGGRHVPRRQGRQDRARRPQRRGQDDAHEDARRASRSRAAAPSTAPARSATCRRTRAPATSTTRPAPASSTPAGSAASCCSCSSRPSTWRARMPRSARRAWTRTRSSRTASSRSAGYAAEAEAAAIASNLALPDRILDQPLKTLCGGQRRRIELARILFSGADTMILDEPTNHLDADSRRLAARVPQDLPGRRHRDQPRRRPHRGGRQQGLLPRRQPPGHRHLQHGLEALPAPARGRRGPPQEGARQRREEGDDAAAAGRAIRREGVEGGRGAPDGRARREDARRASTTCASPTGSRSCASPIPSRAGGRRSAPPTCRRATARSRSSPPSTSRSTAARRSSSWG